jgi:hypothetical protein
VSFLDGSSIQLWDDDKSQLPIQRQDGLEPGNKTETGEG